MTKEELEGIKKQVEGITNPYAKPDWQTPTEQQMEKAFERCREAVLKELQ